MNTSHRREMDSSCPELMARAGLGADRDLSAKDLRRSRVKYFSGLIIEQNAYNAP